MRRSRLRDGIEARARGRCEYCRAPQSICGHRFPLEHILPVALGGGDGPKNRALACASCKPAKSDVGMGRDSLTDEDAPLFHPRRDIWKDHFRWSPSYRSLIRLIPVGRATEAALDLNSSFRQEARLLWAAAGLLPEP